MLIKNKEILPLMQGGMGVGISLSSLAGNVAKNNCIGTISAVNIGFKEKEFFKNPLKANLLALKKEIKRAREISEGNGLIAVNIMTAINNYEEMVRETVKNGADIIVSGAGLPLKLPEYVNDSILVAPIVSSKRALNLIIKSWMKNYKRLPDLVVAEGPLAGGHLGFKNEEDLSIKNLKDIIVEIAEYLKDIEKNFNKRIPLFAAGGIRNNNDFKEMKSLGADGVQIGTPFILTEECDANIKFKEEIMKASDSDIKIIKSPVGMIARAVNNNFLKEQHNVNPDNCINCLKTCNKKNIPYCISKALNSSAKGEKGLVFTGDRINNLNSITTVENVIKEVLAI